MRPIEVAKKIKKIINMCMLSICLLEIIIIQQQAGTIQVWQPNVNKASPNEYKTFEITFAQHADMKFSISNDYCLNGSLHCRVFL